MQALLILALVALAGWLWRLRSSGSRGIVIHQTPTVEMPVKPVQDERKIRALGRIHLSERPSL